MDPVVFRSQLRKRPRKIPESAASSGILRGRRTAFSRKRHGIVAKAAGFPERESWTVRDERIDGDSLVCRNHNLKQCAHGRSAYTDASPVASDKKLPEINRVVFFPKKSIGDYKCSARKQRRFVVPWTSANLPSVPQVPVGSFCCDALRLQSTAGSTMRARAHRPAERQIDNPSRCNNGVTISHVNAVSHARAPSRTLRPVLSAAL